MKENTFYSILFYVSANQLGKRVLARGPRGGGGGGGGYRYAPPTRHSPAGLWADKYLMNTKGTVHSPSRIFLHVQCLSEEKDADKK